MTINDNVRKTLTDTTPLYAVAGTVDLAAEKLRDVPPLLEKLREQVPERLEKVRTTDPKVVQERVAQQAKDVQVRLTEAFGHLEEVDLKKLRDAAQDFALQQVGRAAGYAVKAGETYHGLADRGRGAVKVWRGEDVEGAEAAEGKATATESEAPSAESATEESTGE